MVLGRDAWQLQLRSQIPLYTKSWVMDIRASSTLLRPKRSEGHKFSNHCKVAPQGLAWSTSDTYSKGAQATFTPEQRQTNVTTPHHTAIRPHIRQHDYYLQFSTWSRSSHHHMDTSGFLPKHHYFGNSRHLWPSGNLPSDQVITATPVAIYSPGICFDGYIIGFVQSTGRLNGLSIQDSETAALCIPR